MKIRVTAVVAMDRKGVIGSNNQLPWQLSSDLQRFKKCTMGHTLVMGRKTYDSIGKPLPGRKTIVLTRNQQLAIPKVEIATTWDQVLEKSSGESRIFVVGGAEVYKLLLPVCDDVLVTRVLTEVDGDTFFPDWPWWEWPCQFREFYPQGSRDQWPTETELRVRPVA